MATTFPRPDSVRPVPVSELAEVIPGARLVGAADAAPVTGATLDSRQVLPGDLYAALPGANVHGARFAPQAVEAGAAAVLTDEAGLDLARTTLGEELGGVPFLVVADPRASLGAAAARVYRVPESDRLEVYGITGTNGKTTTAYLVDSGLRGLGRTTGLIGTVETRIAGERLRSTRTTPESSDLQALLAVMAQRGVDRCTMEVSSHALVMHRVDGVVYDVAAFTNLSQDHLDFHGTMEAYYEAKASLLTPERARRAVVVVDDEWGRRLAGETALPVVTVSATGQDADVQVRDLGDQRFRLTGLGVDVELVCPLPGDFNQVNTAVAALVIHLGGEDLEAAAHAVCDDPHVPGRMERVALDGAEHPLAVVDFAHTPDAIGAALRALRAQTPGTLVAVLGAGGARDAGKRPLMGAAAAGVADVVVVTDDNPRDEDPAAIREAVAAGIPAERRQRVHVVDGRASAIDLAVRCTSGPGDTVVVLGKGHEQGQEVAGQTLPFDDRDALRRALTQHCGHDRGRDRDDESEGAPAVEGEIKDEGARR